MEFVQNINSQFFLIRTKPDKTDGPLSFEKSLQKDLHNSKSFFDLKKILGPL